MEGKYPNDWHDKALAEMEGDHPSQSCTHGIRLLLPQPALDGRAETRLSKVI